MIGMHTQSEGTLPQDHEDQLQLGIRIISNAFQNKVHTLEQEVRALRMQADEQRTNLGSLQKKSSALEVELVESHQRSQQLADENKELFKTVGSLRKQVARLEALKTAVITSMHDDAAHEAEIGDTRALMSENWLKSATPLTTREMGMGIGANSLPPVSATPVPREDYYGSGGGGGVQFGSSGNDSGGHSNIRGGTALPANTGGSTSPVIDGKQFFRAARSRLSYEAFNLFLASIKRLNSQAQTREETLEEARRIFGPELQDLYTDFEALLNRNSF